jgi:hypothetical protein
LAGEYFARHNSNAPDLLTGAYQNLLARQPDAAWMAILGEQ